jgi:arabinose-5-phosphate isomerase
MMLALGDALAVATLERRGFTPEDFHRLHPGGKLGKAFIRVRDLMHPEKEVPVVSHREAMSKVLLVMTNKSFGCAGVVDEKGKLAGIITDGDLRRHMDPNLLNRSASDVMTRSPVTIGPDALAAEALAILNARSITCLFVLEGGRPVGILHIHDCLRAGVM